jgi:hypothetical protein
MPVEAPLVSDRVLEIDPAPVLAHFPREVRAEPPIKTSSHMSPKSYRYMMAGRAILLPPHKQSNTAGLHCVRNLVRELCRCKESTFLLTIRTAGANDSQDDGEAKHLIAVGSDGRLRRSARTRQHLIDAYLELLRESAKVPTAAEPAKRAGCSTRSVFERFRTC